MKVEVESIDGGEAKLLVEVEPERVESYLDRAYGKVRNQVRIPGFRQGRAPRFIFERFAGKKTLLEDALKMLLPDSCSEALKAAEIKPFENPKLEVLDFDPDKPLKFRASVLVRPDVILADPKSLVVSKQSMEATPEEVDAEIDRLRNRFAELLPVEERAADSGDAVYLTAKPILDDATDKEPQQMAVELGSEAAPAGFDRDLRGTRPGDEKKIVTTFPDDHDDPLLAGKAVVFEVKVDDIKEKRLPELNDEFAVTVGGFSNLQELRQHVENTLNEAYKERASAASVDLAVQALVDASTVDIPPALVEKRTNDMIEELQHRARAASKEIEEILQEQGKTLEQVKSEMEEEARSSLRRQLVLDSAVEKYNIKVPQEELEGVVTELARAQNQDPKDFLSALQRGAFDDLKASLARNKAATYVSGLVGSDGEPEAGEIDG